MRDSISVSLLTAALLVAATPATAEVVESSDNGFITRDEAVVEANLKETWLALISPSRWWNSAHTFTGDSGNLTLTPQGGGCFCEKVPEIDEPGRFTLEGSVEHLRVVNAMPENALRMIGALGPLQSEPVNGVLTVALSAVEVDGRQATRIVWEYNVGGFMRFEIPVISKAVDGVMTQQLDGLAELLGRIDTPEPEPQPEPEPEVLPEEEEEAEAEEEAPEEVQEEPRGPSVEEAFGDLSDPD